MFAKRQISLFLAALIFALLSPLLVYAAPPSGFIEEDIPRPDGGDWDGAVGMTFASDGTLFVIERAGRVWLVDESNPLPNPPRGPLIDISEEVGNWRDFGLLSVALDPDFLNNGNVYLFYIVDRHHLLNCSEQPSGIGLPDCGPGYDSEANAYFDATIGRITRYTIDVVNDMAVDYSSRKVLLGETIDSGIPSLNTSHGTGTLVFGTDGTLIASTGDGASFDSVDQGSAVETYYTQALADGIIVPAENVGALRSQMLSSLNGKLLRLDPTTGDGVSSNPYYDSLNPRSARSRVWALGLRNPYRIAKRAETGSHDPNDGDPGVFMIGDVGWGLWEDLNVSHSGGENFGWPLFEGMTPHDSYWYVSAVNEDAPNPLFGVEGCDQAFIPFNELIKQDTLNAVVFENSCDGSILPSDIDTFVHTRPVADWLHGSSSTRWASYNASGLAEQPQLGQADSLGNVVAGSPFPGNASVGGVWYSGDDFPATYKNTYFHSDYGASWIKNFVFDDNQKLLEVNNFNNSAGAVIGMATHPIDGRLYTAVWGSLIRRTSYAPDGNQTPTAVGSSDAQYGASPLVVQFNGSASLDSDGSISSWLWDFADGTTSNQANPAHIFDGNGMPQSYNVTLTVTDNEGATDTTEVLISVDNTPPSVIITSPAPGTVYTLSGDTTYNLTADISDAEQDQSTLSCAWITYLHHNEHSHNEAADTNCNTTTTVSPLGCGAETYYFRITLDVTDAEGLTTSKERILLPDCPGAVNQAPTALFTTSAEAGVAPIAIHFDASGSTDFDGAVVDYLWDFGDGSSAAGVNVSHIYATPGTFVATLTAIDDDGDSDQLSINITVVNNWWDDNWTQRRKLSFDNSGIAQSLVDMPVLVRITASDIDYAATSSNGEDIRFIDADGVTVLAHEIAQWNPAGDSLIWVKVAKVDANSTTDHMMLYYANAGVVDAQDALALWSDYAAVWHFDDDVLDASANANHGIDVGTTGASGVIAGARAFNGASYIDAGSDNSLGITSALTLEAWVKFDAAATGSPRIVSKKINWQDPVGYNLEYKPADSRLSALGSGNNPATADGVVLGNEWHYVVASIDAASGRLYVDGVEVTTDTSVSLLAADNTPLNIGRRSGAADYFLGLIDELRIAPTTRSASWVQAQYRAMNGSLVVFDATGGNSAPIVVLTAPQEGASFHLPVDMNLSADAFDSDGLVTSVAFLVDGEQIALDNDAPFAATWSPFTTGSYSVTAVATDDELAMTASTPIIVEITGDPINQAPVVFAGADLPALTGQQLTLVGSVDDDGLPNNSLSINWTSENGPAQPNWPLNDENALTTHIVFPVAGTYTLRLTADDGELMGFDEVSITVQDFTNQSPSAAIQASTLMGRAPLAVSFDASNSFDSDGSINNYAWDFGDGSSASGVTAQHFFNQASDYTVTLTVTDDLGASDVATVQISVAGQWWNNQWTKRRQLKFNNTGIEENLINFPVLVRLTPADVDYSDIQSNGEDLRFIDADGFTVLSHEIATWNPAGESTIWVKVPQINANNSNDFVRLYYSNAIAEDIQDPASVWQAYNAVWHLDADENDATEYANHGFNMGTTPSSGVVGSGRQFDGASFIDVTSSTSIAMDSALTIEAWARFDVASNGSPRILSKKIEWRDPVGYNMEYKPETDTLTALGSGNNAALATPVVLDDSWHYLVATIDGTIGRLYVDGVEVTTDSDVSSLAANDTPLSIGRRSGGADYFLGLLDEVRLSSIAHSPAWIEAQYRAMGSEYVSIDIVQTCYTHKQTCAAVEYQDPTIGVMVPGGRDDAIQPLTPGNRRP